MRPTRTPMTRTPGQGILSRTPAGRTPARGATPMRSVPRKRQRLDTNTKDPVEVYCRVRPAEDLTDEKCITVVSDKHIQLTPPSSSRAYVTGKETQYGFQGIFGEDASQSDVFLRAGLPLVEDLLKGQNGLLFTYGVTGSGKTHTMQGSLEDGGVMNRVIDVIFNSIKDVQTKKFRVIPDRLNGFDIVSDVDAAAARNEERISNIQKVRKVNSSNPDLSGRVIEDQKLNIDEDYQYAMFISYVEVYNNYIYDLLDTPERDIVSGKPKLLSKNLREDSYGNVYVKNVTEVEATNPEEALKAYFKGQKQRKVAQTVLNLQSSRSHSIFNIRLVALPLDHLGQDIICDPAVATISQLSLVDLAGSEKTSRTGNIGDRLNEASKINQSLMTLRTCIEILRENQQTGGNKIVPFRDTKLTHMFRNFFEGEGKVKMIVCVNPRIGDFDENVNVMKFAELTQEVEIERPQVVRFDLGMTPGRRRGNQLYREALKRVEADGLNIEEDEERTLLYTLSNEWPSLEMKTSDDEEVLIQLMSFIKKRIENRRNLIKDFDIKCSDFRTMLLKQEEELILLRNLNSTVNCQLETEKRKVVSLEKRLCNAETANKSLVEKVTTLTDTKTLLENDLDEMELLLNAEQKEKIKTKQKYKHKLQSTKEQWETDIERRNYEERAKRSQINAKINEKLREIQLINEENNENSGVAATRAKFANSDSDLTTTGDKYTRPRSRSPLKASSSDPRLSLVTPGSARKPLAVSNVRHRRSKSAGADKWLDHQPRHGVVPLDTVMQPNMKRRKSVNKLEEKDILKSNKYMLTTQNQLDGGEMETRLYKGNVIPTVSGGRQIVYNDVEVLHQENADGPSGSSPKKRSHEEYRGISDRIADLQERCGQAIDGLPLTPARTRSKVSRI